MNIAIIWTDLAELLLERIKGGGGGGVFVGMGEYVCPLSEFQNRSFHLF